MIGHGTLVFDWKNFVVTDGVIFYRVLSPALLFRFLFPKKKRNGISGWWLVIKDVIIWFKKEKYIYRHFPIQETYTRKVRQSQKMGTNDY